MSNDRIVLPDEFDEFWHERTALALEARLDGRRKPTERRSPFGHRIDEIEFRGIDGTPRHGWLALPDDTESAPGFLWVPPYGLSSRFPDEYGTRPGFLSLSLNLHGYGAFHEEKYTPERGYFAWGIESPETWILGRMYQDCVLAARFLLAVPTISGSAVTAMGMSQGAGLSIWLGAFCPLVNRVVADMPFLGDVRKTLAERVFRYPLKEIKDAMEGMIMGEAVVGNTLAYFDTVHVASRCFVPTQVSLGLRDPACRPDTVRAIFDALPLAEADRRLITYDWGHDWHPDMVANNEEWLEAS